MLGPLPTLGIVSMVLLMLTKCEYPLHLIQSLVLGSNINKRTKRACTGDFHGAQPCAQGFSNQIIRVRLVK